LAGHAPATAPDQGTASPLVSSAYERAVTRPTRRVSWPIPWWSHLRFGQRSVPVDTRSVRGSAADQRVREL